MSDIIDDANDRAEDDLRRSIEAARNPRRVEPVPCGVCHNCEESVPRGHCFCDADCRDDWQARRSSR